MRTHRYLAALAALALGCSSSAPTPPPADAGLARTDAGQPSDAGETLPDAGPPAPTAPSDEQILSTPWTNLEAAPRINGKQDDLHFVSPEQGWSVNGEGNIYRTEDGGQTWAHLLEQPGTFFRAVIFADASRGFVANIGPGYFPGVTDPEPLYETRDGGQTWSAVRSIEGPMPTGICNFTKIDAQHLVGVGRVGGPSFILTTEDGGDTWRSREITEHIAMLIDVRFTSPTEGLVIGGSSTNLEASRTIVLRTEDGGETWTEVFRSEGTRQLGWKFSFPAPDIGYASVLAYDGTGTFLKTADGGRTWAQLDMGVGAYQAKGIGFINPRIGWVGGERFGTPAYRTADGGETWQAAPGLGALINRFRFVDPWTGYAIGAGIHKLSIERP